MIKVYKFFDVFRFVDTNDNNTVLFICRAKSQNEAQRKYEKRIEEIRHENNLKDKLNKWGMCCTHLD